MLAVGESQVQRLVHRVDVLRGIVTHRGQVEPLQDLERLRERRALTPRPGAVNVIAFVVDGNRGRNLNVVSGQIVLGEQPAHLLVVGDDLAAQFSGVDVVPGCRQRGLPTLRSMGRLDVRDGGKGGCQVLLVEHLSLFGSAPTGQVDLGGRRVGVVLVECGLEPSRQVAVHGKAVAGQVDGRAGHLPKGHGPVPGKRCDPRVGSGGGQRREHSGRNPAAVVFMEILD